MTEYELKLSGDLGNWLFFAGTMLNMPENEATVVWSNHHNVGKYLICESREDAATRLFIRNVTSVLDDAVKKEGWWDTFTVTKDPTTKGLWLCKVIEYRLDRNGFVNLEVETILPVDDMKFQKLFSFESNGTWNSIAWWLMMVRSNAFLDKYDFQRFEDHTPNYKVLKEAFPELENKHPEEIGKIILHKYLRSEVTLEEIEGYLNTPSEWEILVDNIWKAVANHTMEKQYGESYPILSKKVANNVTNNGYVYKDKVEWYLQRQLYYYQDLVKENKIKPIDSETDWLAKVELALQYRKSLKEAEKKAKKEKRKSKDQEGE